MDLSQITTGAKKWYPILASILSIILDSIVFLVEIKGNSDKLTWVLITALIGTMMISGSLIWIILHFSRSGVPQSTTTLNCKEIYNLCNPKVALYKKNLRIKFNRPSDFYLTFPPNSDGKEIDFRIFRIINGKEVPLKFDTTKRFGRRVIIIDFGETIAKGAEISDLCVECKLVDSFTFPSDGVAISSEIGQEMCEIEMIFSVEPLTCTSYVYYHNNLEPEKTIIPKKHCSSNGECIIATDFSEFTSKSTASEFSTVWAWDQSQN